MHHTYGAYPSLHHPLSTQIDYPIHHLTLELTYHHRMIVYLELTYHTKGLSIPNAQINHGKCHIHATIYARPSSTQSNRCAYSQHHVCPDSSEFMISGFDSAFNRTQKGCQMTHDIDAKMRYAITKHKDSRTQGQ
eukprot:947722_1